MIGAPSGYSAFTGHCSEPAASSRAKLTPAKVGVRRAISSMISDVLS